MSNCGKQLYPVYGLILGIFFILVTYGCGSESPLTPPPALKRIIETKDISYAGFKRITVRLLIDKDSTEASAKQVAEYIVEKKRSELRGLKGITIWGYYYPPGTGAWQAFMAEWKLNRGLYAFTFKEPYEEVMPKKLAANKYVEITVHPANIYTEPKTTSSVVTKSEKGDLFELRGEESQWFKINLFSGEWRYVQKSVAKITSREISLPSMESKRLEIFSAILAAEDNAQSEADRRYPNNLSKNIDYMRLLNDRYKLDVVHKYGVQPPVYIKIVVEGVKKNW